MPLSTALRPAIRSSPRISFQCLYSTSSSTLPPAPPLLLKLRGDLKTAMKEKDQTRLNVLRAILTEVTNASKSNSPVKTDMQLVSILRKKAAASKAASVEFQTAGRTDLKEKEEAQILVMEEYQGGVEMVSEEEITQTTEELRKAMSAEGIKVDKGSLLRRLVGPGGVYEEKPVDRAMVAKVVQLVLGAERRSSN